MTKLVTKKVSGTKKLMIKRNVSSPVLKKVSTRKNK